MVLRFALIAAWLAVASPGLAQGRIQVVTTTTDLRSLTEFVGGNRIVAVSLVAANMDAEDYQPKPQDVLRLKNAHVLVRVGLDYDLWVDRLLAQAAKPEISRGGPGYVDASFAIAVLELRGMSVGPGDGHAHGSGNPHYWLDPKNAEIITATILEALARIDPANAASYEANRLASSLACSQAGEWEASWRRSRHAHRCLPQQLALFCAPLPLDFRRLYRDQARRAAEPVASRGDRRTMRRAASASSYASRTSRTRRCLRGEQGRAPVVTLAASVGALPHTGDYISLFDANVDALKSAAGVR
jgi:ABC-type Zn uptake system ZnuABC Zn-binding protein ZnuA